MEEFDNTIDNFIYEHFKTIHGDLHDIIFCPDFRILIELKTDNESVSYYTNIIDMTKKYTINQIIKDSELLHFFVNLYKTYNITVLCYFESNSEKNENNKVNPVVLLNKNINIT